jgi:hypothetical protein
VSSSVLIWLVGAVVVAVVGGVLTVRAGRRPAATGGALDRADRVRRHLVGDLGPAGAALGVGAALAALTFAIGWPLGRLAHAVEAAVDVPVFDWFNARQESGGFDSLQDVLTQMGNRPEIKVVAIVAALVLAVAWRRRWWVPVVVLLAAFFVEKYVQAGLARVVDRGHPPTTNGTWPSGGCARLISMYGTILWLSFRTWRVAPRVRGALWTLLAVAAWMEGFARTYRLEHWFTDVVGGWVVGVLLLGAFVATAATLASPRRPTDAADTVPPVEQADGRRPEAVSPV